MKRNAEPVRFRVRRVKTQWVCDFTAHGKRIRKFFSAEESAWAEGDRLKKIVTELGTAGLTAATPEGALTVKAALRKWLNETDPQSRSHTQKLAIFEKSFSHAFYGPVANIDAAALRKWVKARSANGTTQAMYFRYARMFFRFLAGDRLIPHNPTDAIRPPKGRAAKNILTPEQMRDLLLLQKHKRKKVLPMPDHLMALFLLGGFAGLRTEEVFRMRWENINAATGQIHVPPGVMKDSGGYDQRIVDFTEPLTRRREFFEGKSGPICAMAMETFLEDRRKLIQPLMGTWPKNCLRHSFATYHLARAKNAGLTSYQMGHTSSAMVQRVYAVPAALADWQAWWQL
jgi:integrase